MNTTVGLPLIEFPALISSRYRQFFITLQILALLSLSIGCRQSGSSEPPKDHTTIKIGFFGDLSGPTFNFGESAKNGLLMAADEINLGGGIDGRRIDVVIDDDGGSPEKAAAL